MIHNQDFSNPPVSIAISTKDRRDLLSKLLYSLGNLDYPKDKIEIVVVEEGNEPCQIDGVKYIFLPRLNRGFGYTRNIAVKNCSHNLIAFVDDDCEVTSNWLSMLVSYMENDIGGVTGGVLVKDCNIIGYCENLLGFPAGGIKKMYEYNFTHGPTKELVTCNALIRKSAIEDAGGFDETIARSGGEDSMISHKLREKGYKLVYAPEAAVYHKTKDSIFKIFPWAFRMGKTSAYLSRIMGKVKSFTIFSRNSIFLKLGLFALGLLLFHDFILFYILISLLCYWIKIFHDYRFYRNDTKSAVRILLVLPVVKFVFDLASNIGRIAGRIQAGKIRP